MDQSIRVLMEVTANKTAEELPRRDELDYLIQESLTPLSDRSQIRELSSRLSLPAEVPVRLEMSILPRNSEQQTGIIPVKATVLSVPDVMDKMRLPIEDEVHQALFQNLPQIEVPKQLLSALGYDEASKPRFELSFEHERPEAISNETLLAAADCAPGSQYSWSKGCNGWPW